MEDQPGSKYCFAAGDMKVECEDDMDYTPTNRPRPTGEMTEGPDGETDGMTDDGITEDPNGVTGGTTSAPRVITWSFGMSEALECVRPGTSVIFEWSGSSHNVDKVGSAEDYASCVGSPTPQGYLDLTHGKLQAARATTISFVESESIAPLGT